MRSVIIVYDVDGWAWHYRAMDLQRYAPEGIKVEISKPADLGDFSRKFDVAFSMSWAAGGFNSLGRETAALVTSCGHLFDAHDPEDLRTNIVTKSRNARRAKERLPQFSRVIGVNREIVEHVKYARDDCYLIPSPVNVDVFTRSNLYSDAMAPLRVGWCGNPGGHRSVKGFDEILRPLMATTSGIDWQLNTNDYTTALTRDEMVDWYKSVDVLLCTSCCEGTPSPVFEAAACGRAIVSTDVGCVTDWKLPRELGLVVPTYRNGDEASETVSRIKDVLEILRDNRWMLSAMGGALSDSVRRDYSYQVLAREYFDAITGSVPPNG